MVIIGNKFEIKQCIGSGTFGKIYEGINIRSQEPIAIKMEPLNTEINSLKHETKIYQYLNGTDGIPSLKWYGSDLNHRYMVISLLKNSLTEILELNTILSLKDTFTIGINIIYILKSIHEKGLIHRDIKPDNFLFGIGENNSKIYLIDYGMCKRFTLDQGNHIEIKKVSQIIGSLNYCSLNTHNLIEQSRRDDLESVAYILIYLSIGNLLWDKITSSEGIKERKEALISDIKIPGISDTIIDYLKYIRNLEFIETPNYEWIIELFSKNI